MHERNIFKNAPPDFQQLAEEYVQFKPYIQKSPSGNKAYVNFKDPASLRALSTVLLKKYFDVDIDIPLDRLIPTIPLRLNYIHWIEDLLLLQKDGSSSCGEKKNLHGIDIGCGASCVYALLGHKMNEWKFTCTEINEESFNYAINNVKLNQAEGNIKVVLSRSNGCILKHLFENESTASQTTSQKTSQATSQTASQATSQTASQATSQTTSQATKSVVTTKETASTTAFINATSTAKEDYDFCMCNPPFFSEIHDDEEEHSKTRKNRTNHRPPPPSVCTASENESFTHGGEVEFVRKMITESIQLQNKICWYTTMLGKKSSIKTLTKYLKECKVANFTTTEFKQGRTMRWGLAWTFIQNSFSATLSKTIPKKKKTKPFYFDLTKQFYSEYSIPMILPNMPWKQVASTLWEITRVIQNEFVKLKIEINEPEHITMCNKDAYEITGKAFDNTWIHQRQKRRAKLHEESSTASTTVVARVITEKPCVSPLSSSSTETTIKKAIPETEPKVNTQPVVLNTILSCPSSAAACFKSTDNANCPSDISGNLCNSKAVTVLSMDDVMESIENRHLSQVRLVSTCSSNNKEPSKRKLSHTQGDNNPDAKKLKSTDANTVNTTTSETAVTPNRFRDSLFAFKCTIGIGKQFGMTSLDDPTLSLFCFGGNRELFHQMVLYIKNALYCIQLTNKTK